MYECLTERYDEETPEVDNRALCEFLEWYEELIADLS
jgi:hypothetical protein